MTEADEMSVLRQHFVITLEALLHCLIIIGKGKPMLLTDLILAYEQKYWIKLNMESLGLEDESDLVELL